MSLFGLGKKKEEVKIEPACACNGEVATYEASSCCCGGQQIENCCGGDNKVISIKVLGAGCKSCHDQYENVKKAIEELGLEIEVEYITDMEKVTDYEEKKISKPAFGSNSCRGIPGRLWFGRKDG